MTAPPRAPLFVLLLLALAFATACRSPYYADRGAALGGITGAVAGAALGDKSGNAATGAVIGTAVGALTGAAIGDAMDADVARSQAIIEQQMGRSLQGAVTLQDVVAMTHANLSPEVIVTHIRANGVAHPPGAYDLIMLRNNGVSDAVIQALQQTPPPQVVYPLAASPPVIVEEHYYVRPYPPPPFWHYDYHYHRHRRPPPRRGVSWGISVRH